MSNLDPYTSRRPSITFLSYNEKPSFSLGCAHELFTNNVANAANWYDTDVQLWTSCVGNNDGEKQRLFERDSVLISDAILPLCVDEQPLLDLITDLYHSGKRLIAFGTGIELLAKTGLLDGKTVATDPRYIDEQSEQYPTVNFNAEMLFSGEDNIYCAPSSVAALKLGIHLISLDFDQVTATKVAKILSVPSIQLKNPPKLTKSSNAKGIKRLLLAMEWAEKNLSKIDSLDQLANKAFMSRRSFDRQFRASFNQSPKEWLTAKRLSLAISYLEGGDLCIEEIAGFSGFGSAVNFRNNFRNNMGISPTEYRSTFSSQMVKSA